MKMGEVELTPEKPRKFLGCGCAVWLLIGLVLFLLVSLGIGLGELEAGWLLLTGWAGFLSRTLPRITWNWDLIGMGMVCAAGTLFITHRFLRWVTASIAAHRGTTFRWPWRWTWCGLASLAVLFLVGMAVGGAAHQIGWMRSSSERMVERRPAKEFFDMREIETALNIQIMETNSATQVRQKLWLNREHAISPRTGAATLLQSYHVLLIAPSNSVEGWIIYPRNPSLLNRLGGRTQQGGDVKRLLAPEVREEVERLRNSLVPL